MAASSATFLAAASPCAAFLLLSWHVLPSCCCFFLCCLPCCASASDDSVDIQTLPQVGSRAVLMPGSVLGQNVTVCEHSLISEDMVAPPDTIWKGSPAQPSDTNYYDEYLKTIDPSLDAKRRLSVHKISSRHSSKVSSRKSSVAQAPEQPGHLRQRRNQKSSKYSVGPTNAQQRRMIEHQKTVEQEDKWIKKGFNRSYGKSLVQASLILFVLPILKFVIQLPALIVFLLNPRGIGQN